MMNSADDASQQAERYAPPPHGDGLRGWIAKLRDLYEGEAPEAHRFRYGLLVFDLVTVLFIVVTSFLPRTPLFEVFDILFGFGILADVAARLAVCPNRWKALLSPLTLIDFIAVASFLAKEPGSCVFCAPCACCTATSYSHACGPTAHSFVVMRGSSSLS